MKRLIGFILLVISGNIVLGQSPWVAEKGHGFVQLGFSTIGPYSKLFLEGDGEYILGREVLDRTLQFYGEYGIGKKTSMLGAIPFKMLSTGDIPEDAPDVDNPIEKGSYTTLGNIQLGIRHNLLDHGYVLSSQLLIELPSGDYDDATGLSGGVDALTFFPTISIGVGKENVYGYLSTGFGIRTNNYSSDFRLGGEVGYQVIKRLYLIGVLDVVSNFENGNAKMEVNNLQTGLYLNNQSYFAYGFKTIIGFSDTIGLTGGYYSAAGGNLVARSPSLNFGVYFKW